jgi:hypothetical protein
MLLLLVLLLPLLVLLLANGVALMTLLPMECRCCRGDNERAARRGALLLDWSDEILSLSSGFHSCCFNSCTRTGLPVETAGFVRCSSNSSSSGLYAGC